ncbi:MAG: 2-phospho-L-lactate transferase [Ilumatobacteraceae bacterium]
MTETALLRIALDTGPLVGPRTGIGIAVDHMLLSLQGLRGQVDVLPYVLSFRAALAPGTTRLPFPAAVAHRLWVVRSRPRLDRFLGRPDVVHGTNYVVPPVRVPRVVSVYDCWFLRHPEGVHPDVARAANLLRRAVADGAVVHASSEATAREVRELLGPARVEVVHLGYVPLPPAPADRPDEVPALSEPFVLAVGTVERRKDLATLVEAFGLLGTDHPDAQLSWREHRATIRLAWTRPATGSSRRSGDGFISSAGSPTPPSPGSFATPRSSPIPRSTRASGSPCSKRSVSDAGGGQRRRLRPGGRRRPRPARASRSTRRVRGRTAPGPGGRRRSPPPRRRRAGPRARLRLGRHGERPRRALPSPGDGVHCVITVLAGGVGAARYLQGLVGRYPDRELVAVVNVGDDTELHGLSISPDLDTITYTLAGAIDPERGWGLRAETWRAMEALDRYGAVRPEGSRAGERWFNLGDQDLATHFYRTARRVEGATLTQITAEITRAWELPVSLLPVTDAPVRTMVTIDGAEVSFQEYFVGLRHSVPVEAVRFAGAAEARPTSAVMTALHEAERIVIAPSNPLVSIGPLRAVPGIEDLLRARRDDVVAVSPIVAGAALKGPADRMLRELGHEPTVVGVARLYRQICATLVVDLADEASVPEIEALGA